MNFFAALMLSQFLGAPYQVDAKVPRIQDAQYLGNNQLSITYSYSGGCAEHSFALEIAGYCSRSLPQQCPAELVEIDPVADDCEAYITKTEIFEIAEAFTQQPTILQLHSGADEVFPVEIYEQAEAGYIVEESRLISFKLSPINAGINPLAFAFEISGVVQLGSNSCHAAGVTAEFRQELIDNVLYVTPVRKIPEAAFSRFCTFQYQPVFGEIRGEIRGFSDEIDAIVIRNVKNIGNDKTIPVK